MIGALKVLTKRPTDKTIRLSLTLFGLIYIASLGYNLLYQNDSIEAVFFGWNASEAAINYIKYVFISLGLIPLIIGATGINILKSSHMRIFQIVYGIVLFYVASKIVDSPDLEIDTLIILGGFISILAGVSGKLITKSGLKHGQKITKIRV